jgi:hypothetical protein
LIYPKDFSPILALGLVLICVYLLMTGRLTGGQLWPSLLVCLLIVVTVHNLDVIDNLAVKGPGGTEAVVQMQRLRDDVYAKVEELRKLAIGVAKFTAASIVSENRFAGEDHQDRMLRRRDELETFLAHAGVSEAERQDLTRPITLMVDWDMRRAIVIKRCSVLAATEGHGPERSG